MTDRKFTPPTEFPAEYVNGTGERVTLIGRGRGKYPLVGQFGAEDEDSFFTYREDGRYSSSSSDSHPYNLYDLPKRILRWQNFYSGVSTGWCTSRRAADNFAFDDRICVHRIECDEDGRNPEIFVEPN